MKEPIRIPASLFEALVFNLLKSSLPGDAVQQLRSGPDFEIAASDDRSRTFVEVKADLHNPDQLSRLWKLVQKVAGPGDEFILVTPNGPTPPLATTFDLASRDRPYKSSWVSLQALPDAIGVASPGDMLSWTTMARLQTASLVNGIERYSAAPVGPEPSGTSPDATSELESLARQFGHRTLATLVDDSRPVDEALQIGRRIEGVTVVLSDVVNFSSLVSASSPEELREGMSRYYRLAREAVFRHGGMLDKFIGDAVLAVFGYPFPGSSDSASALRLARELVSIGEDVLGPWQEQLNAVVPTGTRVGLATGELWAIDIGDSQLEITLLGDTINRAARLEKKCMPNNLLMDNKTKLKAAQEDAAFVDSLHLEQLVVDPSDAKGQPLPLRAWQMADLAG